MLHSRTSLVALMSISGVSGNAAITCQTPRLIAWRCGSIKESSCKGMVNETRAPNATQQLHDGAALAAALTRLAAHFSIRLTRLGRLETRRHLAVAPDWVRLDERHSHSSDKAQRVRRCIWRWDLSSSKDELNQGTNVQSSDERLQSVPAHSRRCRCDAS